jgi:aryl-alcohol dehydrogenase-like predicted oxidoreductase
VRVIARRPLGTTGIDVFPWILGCGSIGGIGSPQSTRGKGLTPDEGLACIDRAVALGVNILDTANSYAGGESERVVGDWLATHPDADVLVATKVGNIVEPGQTGPMLSAAHVARQAQASLSRLGRIDLYQSHTPDDHTPIEETLEAFAALLEAGTIRAIGACNVTAAQLTAALDAADRLSLPSYAWVQNEFNLLAAPEQADVLRVVRERGLGFTPYSPLAGGILTGQYKADAPPPRGSRMAIAPGAMRNLDAKTFRGLDALASEADRRGVSVAGLALAWVMSSPDVTAPLVAPRRPHHFDAVTEALELCLDPDERDRLAGLFQ